MLIGNASNYTHRWDLQRVQAVGSEDLDLSWGRRYMLEQKSGSVHKTEEGCPLHGPNVRTREADVVAGHGHNRPAIPRWSPHFQARLVAVAGVLSDESDDVHDRDQLDDGMVDDVQFQDEALQQEVDADWKFGVWTQNPTALFHPGIPVIPSLQSLQGNRCTLGYQLLMLEKLVHQYQKNLHRRQ